MTKKVPVIFNNSRVYDSHLIMQKISRSDVKISIIPNRLKKCIAFTMNNNLVFIDSMQLMNSSLDPLVTNLSDNGFKQLSQEVTGNLSELVKQTGVYPYKCMDNFKKFFDDKLPERYEFFSSLKDECISEKDYLLPIDVCNVFEMNKMGNKWIQWVIIITFI